VLERLDPTDRALFSRAGGACRAAVVDSRLSRAGRSAKVPLRTRKFVGSVAMLQWANENRCPWNEQTCADAAGGGRLEAGAYTHSLFSSSWAHFMG